MSNHYKREHTGKSCDEQEMLTQAAAKKNLKMTTKRIVVNAKRREHTKPVVELSRKGKHKN